MTVHVLATLSALPGFEEELHAALQALAAASRGERGNERYALFREEGQAGVFHLIEAYRDADALAEHRRAPHYTTYRDRTREWLSAPPTVRILREQGNKERTSIASTHVPPFAAPASSGTALASAPKDDANSRSEPSMRPLLRIDHVAIICSDLEASRAFYAEILGFPVVSELDRPNRQSRKLDLTVPGGGRLELFSFPETPPRPSYPEACGLRHLAFAVPDIDAAIAWLAHHDIGVEAIRFDEGTGTRFTFFADPDGLPLELHERTVTSP
jgi:glyoxylase I family protein